MESYTYIAPPCACQIQTAVDLCRGRGISEFLDFVVRTDERIPSSCRRMTTGLALLSSLRNYANEIIASGTITSPDGLYRLAPARTTHLQTREAYEAPNASLSGLLRQILSEENTSTPKVAA